MATDVWQVLNPVTKDLLARLIRELDERAPNARPTEKLGGVVKAGAELERFLEVLLTAVAESQGDLDPRIDGWPLESAGAGQLLRELRRRWALSRNPTCPHAVRALMQTLQQYDNDFYLFIDNVRNRAAHEGTLDDAAATRLMNGLRGAIITFRRQMAWNT